MFKNLCTITALILLLLVNVTSFAAGKDLSLIPLKEFVYKNTKKAYAIVEVSAGGIAPSIELSKLDKDAENYDFKINRYQRINYQLELKDINDGFYVFEIPEGLYQIIKVNAPLFNLPYRYDTEGRNIWRWSIKKDEINYVGQLNIHKDRSEKSISADLINRFSQSLPELNATLERLSITSPLRIGLGYRDDFYKEIK